MKNIVLSSLASIFLSYLFFYSNTSEEPDIIYIDKIIFTEDVFDEDVLANEIKELNVKFPHIVYAQSILETGYWNSKIFVENNNLFGMKSASSRITTSRCNVNGHAYYNNWKESLYDYALYQSSYLRKIKTEDEYLNYLSNSYAGDPGYVRKIKSIIKTKDLYSKFNVYDFK